MLPNLIKKNEVQILINFGNDINIIILAYTSKLGFRVYQTNVKAQKIDDFTFEIFEIILASFQIEISLKEFGFFKKSSY